MLTDSEIVKAQAAADAWPKGVDGRRFFSDLEGGYSEESKNRLALKNSNFG